MKQFTHQVFVAYTWIQGVGHDRDCEILYFIVPFDKGCYYSRTVIKEIAMALNCCDGYTCQRSGKCIHVWWKIILRFVSAQNSEWHCITCMQLLT